MNQQWYALLVRTRSATLTAASLNDKGYEVFLPTYVQKRKWSDRYVAFEKPLFPGYLFCRLNPLDRMLPILTTPGVMSILSAGRMPIPVPDSEIDAIKSLLNSGLSVLPFPDLTTGTKVLLEKGPLTGIHGVVTTVGKSCRLIVSVEILHRSVMVEIDRDWVRVADVPMVRPGVQTQGAVRHLAA